MYNSQTTLTARDACQEATIVFGERIWPICNVPVVSVRLCPYVNLSVLRRLVYVCMRC